MCSFAHKRRWTKGSVLPQQGFAEIIHDLQLESPHDNDESDITISPFLPTITRVTG